MMKKTLKLASLTFLMFGCAVASEFRPPLSADRGPQRLDMNIERDADSNWDLNMWSMGYSRNAVKAYDKHGRSTTPFSTLIFGKDKFKVSDALAGDLTSKYSEEFNANLNSTPFYPRVSYSETGINLGAAIGYRVWNGKGSVGVKFNIPLKTVRMERDNNAETAEIGGSGLNVILGDTRTAVVPVTHAGPGGTAGAAGDTVIATVDRSIMANMYKLSAVANLPVVSAAGAANFFAEPNAAPGAFTVGGQPYNTDPAVAAIPADFGGLRETNAVLPYVFLYNPDAKILPITGARAIKLPAAVQAANWKPLIAVATGATELQNVGIASPAAIAPAGAAGLTAAALIAGGPVAAVADYNLNDVIVAAGGDAKTPIGQFIVPGSVGHNPGFVTHQSNNGGAPVIPAASLGFAPLQVLDPAVPLKAHTMYVLPGAQTAVQAAATKKFLADNADNLWLMSVANNAGNGLLNNGVDEQLQSLYNRYTAQSAEQWLFMNGYTMQTNQRTGLGDITINPCYDHSFSAAWQGGVYAHVLIPSGGSRKGGDPYKARLGNDNHVELGGGANVAWQALDWMNIRLDAMAAYALPGKERIAATFKDATVKAVGPAVDADIDYTRVKASVDTTLVHPQASSLAMTIGYDFEFKTKDNVSLKDKTYTFKPLANDANSWFGGFWDNAAPAGFKAKTAPLDGSVHAKDSERISHNIRVESSWHATEKLSLFWGGSAPIAGQHVAKMSSIYGGMNVKY